MSHYTLKLTPKQAHLVEKALDFYSRIGIGQWHELINVINEMMTNGSLPASTDGVRRDDRFERALRDAKMSHLGLARDSHFGISHPKVGDDIKVAYDVSVVLRRVIATVEEHQPYSVWHDKPLHLGTEPLAEGSYEKD